MAKLKNGQNVYLKVLDKRSKYYAQGVVEARIIKVGRKYYTVELTEGYPEILQFSISDNTHVTEYSADYFLYESKQAFIDDGESKKLLSSVIEALQRKSTLSLDKLKRIQMIIDEE